MIDPQNWNHDPGYIDTDTWERFGSNTWQGRLRNSRGWTLNPAAEVRDEQGRVITPGAIPRDGTVFRGVLVQSSHIGAMGQVTVYGREATQADIDALQSHQRGSTPSHEGPNRQMMYVLGGLAIAGFALIRML